ncbi:hypothetical protein ACTNCH_03265 [Candidatus Merdisoma sp. HCP28S3_D10]|uniref:hypothetical protein n=2 Tax=unclassified Candidatus Merdisoma TaxID=3099611 RepID=UPI003F8B3E52
MLVDRGETGLTTGEAIACLWQDRCADEKMQTLYRVTFYQLMDELKKNRTSGFRKEAVAGGKSRLTLKTGQDGIFFLKEIYKYCKKNMGKFVQYILPKQGKINVFLTSAFL